LKEEEESGAMLFHDAMEAMEEVYHGADLEQLFQLFEGAATKGHEESIWIGSVVKGVTKEKIPLREAFAQTKEPLGYYFAGMLSEWISMEAFSFFKKSAEAGCGWGQVQYAWYFKYGDIVEEDHQACSDWLEKAAKQNNRKAMEELGEWFTKEGTKNEEKAVSYSRAAAELGSEIAMTYLAGRLKNGTGCAVDLRQAAVWSVKGDPNLDDFWEVLVEAQQAFENYETANLGNDFDQLCYTLGWGLYWYFYEFQHGSSLLLEDKFEYHCLDYYISCFKLQRKSIFTFLLCWNRTTGVKGPGQMIAQMVWEGREDNLVQSLDGQPEEASEPEFKRMKK
jgi:hypothetical protein